MCRPLLFTSIKAPANLPHEVTAKHLGSRPVYESLTYLQRALTAQLMEDTKTWRGETGISGILGTDEHRLKYAQRNIAATE